MSIEIEPSIRAGLIPYYKKDGVFYFCCIETPRNTIEFSKGHIDYSETEQQCAIREAFEELGYKNKPDHKIVLVCSSNRIDFFMTEVKETELNSWKRPVFKSEIKNVLWINNTELQSKIVSWQFDIFQRVLRKLGINNKEEKISNAEQREEKDIS